MVDELRELFARSLVRAVFVATVCGYAAVSFVRGVIHGFVTTPIALPAKLGFAQLGVIDVVGYSSRESISIAGRSVDWVAPLEAAIVLALVLVAATWIMRATR